MRIFFKRSCWKKFTHLFLHPLTLQTCILFVYIKFKSIFIYLKNNFELLCCESIRNWMVRKPILSYPLETHSNENHKYLINSYTNIWSLVVIKTLRKIQDALRVCKKITLCILEENFVIHLSNKREFVDDIYPSDLHGQKFNVTELSFYLYPFFAFCSLVSHLVVLSHDNKTHLCCWVHAQSCPTLWPMDCSPPGSSVCGIFQARITEWVAISYSRESGLGHT